MKRNTTIGLTGKGFARLASSHLVTLALVFSGLPGLLSAQTLLHRYSFATNANDSVGTANGVIVGPNGGVSASISNGLVLPGGGGGGYSGYVALPSEILTSTASVTVECWATQNTGNTWATIWDFAIQPGVNFGLVPHPGNNNGNMEVAFDPNNNEVDLQSTFSYPNNSEQYTALTFNSSTLAGRLYDNGALLAANVLPSASYTPGTIGGGGGTTENWLGNDTYGDTQFQGTVYELRIWTGAISQRQVAASAILGAATLVNNLTPTAVNVSSPGLVLTGTAQATVTVTLPQTGSTLLTATLDATNWISGNTNILTVSSTGLISAVSAGTTTVSATVGGVSGNTSVTVGPQSLDHRWSFNESSGSTAFDSVGTSNIALLGSTSLGGGVLTLPGGSGNIAQFPNGILTPYNSITIETWLTDTAGTTWARPWSFGGSTTGPNNNFIQNNYIDLIPHSGPGPLYAEFNHNGNTDAIAPSQLPTGTEEYVAVTYNSESQVIGLYVNGVEVGVDNGVTITPSSLGFTYNNFIGLDQWNDPVFTGTFDEMRLWNGAVSQRYLSASAVAGPNVVINQLTPSTLSVNAATNMVVTGTEQAVVDVTLPQTGATNLVATSDATNWISGNTSILTVSSAGLITGVAPGTTTVSATVAGVSSSVSITVAPQTLLHRYSFASDTSDSVGGPSWMGNIIPPNGGTAVTISNGLVLPGGGGGGHSGYVAFPSGILTNTTSLTVECWATQNSANTWATIWDFANNGNQNFGMIAHPGNNSGNLEIAFTPNGGEVDLQSSFVYPNNSEQYTAMTFNSSTLAGNLYDNGALLASHVFPNATYTPGVIGGGGGTAQNWLGNDTYGDTQFQGTVYELRIWNGAVTPLYTYLSSVAGSGVVITNTTATSLALSAPQNTMPIGGTQTAVLTGTFPQLTQVIPNTFATWTSANTNILTVNSAGVITAVGAGGSSTTVSATFQGTTLSTQSITNAFVTPVIGTQPSPLTLNVNDTAVFTVVASGGGLNYQWFFGANAISGATNSSLSLPDITLANGGSYSVEVYNTAGTNYSNPATLTDAPALQHEWSFSENGGTTAFDSIGSSNITLNGNTSLGGGVLSLPGTSQGDYAQFPNGMVSTYNSITVETWLTDNAGKTWATPWCFGGSTSDYICMIPTAGRQGGLWFAFNLNGEADVIDSSPMPLNTEQYITMTYDAQLQTATMYANGVQVASTTGIATTPASLGFTLNNYLGLDQFNDGIFQGSIDEMRIWNGTVSPLYELVSVAAGPNVVVNNLTPVSGTVAIAASSPMTAGATQQATVTANFPQVSGVTVTTFATNWISSDTNVITVTQSGVITAVTTGTGGSATVSATVAGTTGSISISVPQAAPTITQDLPATVELLSGGTLSLTIANIGLQPYIYTWYVDYGSGPQLINGATTATLTLPNAAAGSYSCVVANNYGPTPSSTAVVTLVTPTPYQTYVQALGALAYWPLNETGGTVAYDVTGGHNGTYIGGVYLGYGGVPYASFGPASYSPLFDGATGYVDVPEGPFNITGAITIMAWFNATYLPTFGDIIGHGDNSWRLTALGAQDGNANGYPGANDGNPQNDATYQNSIADGNWHFLVYTYTGIPQSANNGSLYVDGFLAANNTITAVPTGDNLDVIIGGAPDYNNRYLAANISDIAVFTHQVSASDVAALNTLATQGPVSLSIVPSGTNVTVSWTPSTGTLLQSTNVLGPWTTNRSAVSPFTNGVSGTAEFYKVQVLP